MTPNNFDPGHRNVQNFPPANHTMERRPGQYAPPNGPQPGWQNAPAYGGGGYGGGGHNANSSGDGVDGIIRDLFAIVLKWWWLIALCLGIALAAAYYHTSRQTPMYSGSATLEVKQQEQNIFGDIAEIDKVTANKEFMTTQLTLLRSSLLLQKVVQRENIMNDPNFVGQNASEEDRIIRAAAKIRGGLTVTPIRNSRIIILNYKSDSPKYAASIPNAVADTFLVFNQERSIESTAGARGVIEQRLLTTKAALEDAERKLAKYAEENGIVTLSGNANTSEEEAGGSLDSAALITLNRELTATKTRRIQLQRRYEQMRSNPLAPEIQNDEGIVSLKRTKRTLQEQYQSKLEFLKPGFPEMVELQNRIADLDTQLAEEQANLIATARAEYETAAALERSLQSRVNGLKNSVTNIRNDSIDYNILKREVDTIRSQYDALLQRMKDVVIVDGVGSNLVAIVDRAKVPARPFSPNLRRSLMIAALLGLGVGCAIAYLLTLLDDKIKTPDDVRSELQIPVLGVVPYFSGKKKMVDHLEDTHSHVYESYASIRTSLQYLKTRNELKCIQVTSTRSKEGKSSTSYALAHSFAALGKTTLIIDSDLRLPAFTQGSDPSIGLAGLLTSNESISPHVRPTNVDNLYLLHAGTPPSNPSELLASHRLHEIIADAKSKFDMVIIDSPPVLGMADALIIGAAADGTILVLESRAIRKKSARLTLERLMPSCTEILGTILSKYKSEATGYYDYYQYSYGKQATGYGKSRGRKRKTITNKDRKINIG